MRRTIQLALFAVIVLLLGATTAAFIGYRKASTDYTAMKAAEESARSQYTEAFNAIAEIQDSLNAITVANGAVQLRAQGLQAEQKLNEPTQQEALESIALLKASIERTKEKIGDLENTLRKSGLKVAGLQHMVAKLQQQATQKEEQIAALTTQVEQLHTQVAGLETTVQEDKDTLAAREQTIEDKRRELGTIYYVIGSKKDLMTSGIVVAKGGVVGLGKTLQLSGRYDESRFTALDTDQEDVVRAPSAKVQVLSPQPTASYELKIEGKEVVLHILDPKEFRKVKHLVIMTA